MKHEENANEHNQAKRPVFDGLANSRCGNRTDYGAGFAFSGGEDHALALLSGYLRCRVDRVDIGLGLSDFHVFDGGMILTATGGAIASGAVIKRPSGSPHFCPPEFPALSATRNPIEASCARVVL